MNSKRAKGNEPHENVSILSYIGVTLWWLPFNIFWSIMLVHGLQIRVEAFFEPAYIGRALAWLNAIGATVSTLTQLLVAPLSDSLSLYGFRRRAFLVFGTLLATPPLFIFLRCSEFHLLCLSFSLLQFAHNCAAAPFQALIPDVLPPDKHGVASAYMAMWALIGNTVGMVASWLILGRAYRLLDLSDAQALSILLLLAHALLLVVSFLTLFMVNEPISKTEFVTVRKLVKNIRKIMSFSDVIEHRSFMWLFISRLFIQMGVYGSIPFLRWYVRDTLKCDDIVLNTTFISICALIGSAIAIPPAGKLADIFSKRLLIFIACSIAICGGIAFVCAKSVATAMFAALMLGIGFGAFSAVDWALACNLVPLNLAAKFMAVFHIAFTLPQAVAGLVGGYIGDIGNSVFGRGAGWRLTFLACMVYFFIGAVLIRNVKERPVTVALRKCH
ncbi:MAG: hypothetical protein RUDDFDWM_000238 [Candidatus Fervidibacterota bacterium]